ncbi:hypothetical protein MTO96_017030 [Rhipicephalus appendiculatus]
MASSDHPPTEAVQPTADEKWVFLQTDGDSVKEQLLEEQDGDSSGQKESILNTVEGEDGGPRHGKVRPYVLGAAVFSTAVLHVLLALASLTEHKTLEAALICLKHFTTAILSVAVSSMVTRFLSLSAFKARVVKKMRPFTLLSDLAVLNIEILLVSCIACIYELGAGLKVFHEARQEENFGWFLQLFADMARVQALTWTVLLTASLVKLMGTDISVTLRAMLHHRRQRMEESWKLAASRMLERPHNAYRRPFIFRPWTHVAEVFIGAVLLFIVGMLFLLMPTATDRHGHAAPATSGGI